MPGNNSSTGSEEDLNRLGASLGAMAQSNADQGPEHGPIPSDLETAAHLGERVATVASQFAAAKKDCRLTPPKPQPLSQNKRAPAGPFLNSTFWLTPIGHHRVSAHRPPIV